MYSRVKPFLPLFIFAGMIATICVPLIRANTAAPPAPSPLAVYPASVQLETARDAQGVSPGWVERMKHAMHECGARFTAQRMLRQYVVECYAPAMRRDTAGDDPPTG